MQNTLRKILTFKKVQVSPRLSKILVPFWLNVAKDGSSTIRAAVWQIRTDSLLLAAQITWARSAPDAGDAGDAGDASGGTVPAEERSPSGKHML
jgi:hypothetical protein